MGTAEEAAAGGERAFVATLAAVARTASCTTSPLQSADLQTLMAGTRRMVLSSR